MKKPRRRVCLGQILGWIGAHPLDPPLMMIVHTKKWSIREYFSLFAHIKYGCGCIPYYEKRSYIAQMASATRHEFPGPGIDAWLIAIKFKCYKTESTPSLVHHHQIKNAIKLNRGITVNFIRENGGVVSLLLQLAWFLLKRAWNLLSL